MQRSKSSRARATSRRTSFSRRHLEVARVSAAVLLALAAARPQTCTTMAFTVVARGSGMRMMSQTAVIPIAEELSHESRDIPRERLIGMPLSRWVGLLEQYKYFPFFMSEGSVVCTYFRCAFFTSLAGFFLIYPRPSCAWYLRLLRAVRSTQHLVAPRRTFPLPDSDYVLVILLLVYL